MGLKLKSTSLLVATFIAGGLALTHPASAKEHPSMDTHTVLIKKGDTGYNVSKLQRYLHTIGLYNYKIDGIFGPITYNGVLAFQKMEGIQVDGIVGDQTKDAMTNHPLNTDNTQSTPNTKPEVTHQASPQPTQQTVKPIAHSDVTASQTLTVTSTAYTASCAGCSGTTATGINLNANPNMKVIAVDPSVIPLGSKVYVEGYGVAVAGDTGSAIQGNRIDLFMANREDALNYGRQTVQVTILK